MRKHVRDGVCDLLLLELCLGLGDGEVMPLALVGREHRQQDDREHREDYGQQRRARLRESLVCDGGTGQTDDLGVDGVIAQQGRGGHCAQTRNKRHYREGEHRGYKRREDDLPEHLKGLCAHVARGLDGVVVNAADSVSEEERVVTGAGEGHCKQHRAKAREPVLVHAGESVHERVGQDAVRRIEEQIARDKGNAAVDKRRHIAKAQDTRALDVEVLRQQDDGNTDDVHRHDKAERKLQRVPDVFAHVAREEEADDRKRVALTGGVRGVEDAHERVEAGQQHEAEEQIDEQPEPYYTEHKFRRDAPVKALSHYFTSASAAGS